MNSNRLCKRADSNGIDEHIRHPPPSAICDRKAERCIAVPRRE